MSIESIMRNFFSDLICAKLGNIKYKMHAIKYKSVMQQNAKFYKLHEGKRCYIFGNGPSLSQLDFSKFENEYVFTVNQIARKEGYEKLKINYHIWADPFFFKLDSNKPEDAELMKQMLNVRTEDNNPICFFPVDQLEFVNKNIQNHLISYFFMPRYSLQYNRLKKIDYTKVVPSFYTVVQYAITLAIYMGFKEIILLGCETSNILTSINTRLNVFDEKSYSYNLTDNEKKRMKKVSEMTSFREDLYNNLQVIDDYKELNDYCSRQGIKLLNSTPGGLLEDIERKNISEILKND